MASVGGVTCTFVKGTGSALKPEVALWRRPGIDGYFAQNTGYGDSAFRFTAIGYMLTAAVLTWISAIEALQGSQITIIDDHGTTWTNMLVIKVSPPRRQIRVNHDGNGNYRVEIDLEGVKVA